MPLNVSGRYRIVKSLGKGGMAEVYQAFDLRLERNVALKVIRSGLADETFLRRFELEAKALAQMDHPNIVKVLDYGDENGIPYLVMVYLPGGTLKQKLGSHIPYREAARLLSPVAQALDYAHQMKVIHRDVKPANILLSGSGLPLLTDFGIAKLMETESSIHLTSTGMGIGTPEYMAPEQWLGSVVPQTDIYALGVVFYEMITGRRPYMAETPAAVLLKVTNDPLPRPRIFVPDLPDAVERTLYKALAKRPEDRFENMGKFAAALTSLAIGSEPDVQVSYEGTQFIQRAAPTSPPAQASETARALIETANTLESQGNHSGALELYKRAATMTTSDSALQWQIRQSIQRLEQMLAPARTQPQPEPPHTTTQTNLRSAEPVRQPGGAKRWGWLWAVAGFSVILFIGLAIAAVYGISTLLKNREGTASAGDLPTKTLAAEVTHTLTLEPAVEFTPTITFTPTVEFTPTLAATPTLTMPLQSLVNNNCSVGDFIQSIEAVDPLTVKFTLCKPDSSFIHKMALPDVGIQPADYVVQTQGQGDFFNAPIGTGPYKLVEWIRGSHITLQAFEDYHGQPAQEETVTIRFESDYDQIIAEIEAGSADFAFSLPTDYIYRVSENPGVVKITQDAPSISYIGMNNRYAPFNDIRFRQALAMGIDRESLVQDAYPEGTEVLSYLVPCNVPDACQGEPWYSFDPEQARTLLGEMGYSSGTKLKLYYRDVARSYQPDPQALSQNLQDQLSQNLGIEVEVISLSAADFLSMYFDGTLDGLFVFGWIYDFLHPNNHYGHLFDASASYLGDPYQKLVELEMVALNTPFDTDIYRQMNNQIREDIPVIPLAKINLYHLANPNIKNVSVSAIGDLTLNQISTGDGEIIVLEATEPAYLNSGLEYGLGFGEQMAESLMAYDENNNVVPSLAESYDVSADGLEWTFHLKPGVYFHNGKALDANDVVLTFTALLDTSSPYHVTNGDVYYNTEYLFGLIND